MSTAIFGRRHNSSNYQPMLSKSCEYALRAAIYLSSLDSEGYVPIRTISKELDISSPFLTKIFQKLNEADLLASHRGPKGGVALTRPPEKIPLYDIVVAIDGRDLFDECVLGLPGCGDSEPCPLHDQWSDEKERFEQIFRDSTLAELPETPLTTLE